MKIWFDKNDVDFNTFTQEQFLIAGEFNRDVVIKNKDFNNVEWVEQISKKVRIVENVQEADFILYPNKLDNQIHKYTKLNKQVLAFYNDDNDTPVKIDNLTLFRTSIRQSKKNQNEHSMPAWSADFKPYIRYKNKQNIPIIGFCGAITHPIRQGVINNLQNNQQIRTNFIVRNQFWGGSVHNPALRNEYIDNMLNSDFIVCSRGAGNFSYRLYETLSMGKIPIILDTDISLPCQDVVDYNRFIVTSNPSDIVTMIINCWNSMSDEMYIDLQKYSRYVYDKYISPPGFTDYILHNHIIK